MDEEKKLLAQVLALRKENRELRQRMIKKASCTLSCEDCWIKYNDPPKMEGNKTILAGLKI